MSSWLSHIIIWSSLVNLKSACVANRNSDFPSKLIWKLNAQHLCVLRNQCFLIAVMAFAKIFADLQKKKDDAVYVELCRDYIESDGFLWSQNLTQLPLCPHDLGEGRCLYRPDIPTYFTIRFIVSVLCLKWEKREFCVRMMPQTMKVEISIEWPSITLILTS